MDVYGIVLPTWLAKNLLDSLGCTQEDESKKATLSCWLARPRIGPLSLPRVGHAVVTKQLLAAPGTVEPQKFLVGVWTFTIALVAVRLSGNKSHEQDPPSVYVMNFVFEESAWENKDLNKMTLHLPLPLQNAASKTNARLCLKENAYKDPLYFMVKTHGFLWISMVFPWFWMIKTHVSPPTSLPKPLRNPTIPTTLRMALQASIISFRELPGLAAKKSRVNWLYSNCLPISWGFNVGFHMVHINMAYYGILLWDIMDYSMIMNLCGYWIMNINGILMVNMFNINMVHMNMAYYGILLWDIMDYNMIMNLCG